MKNLTMISLEDFKTDVTFKYGMPLIILDFFEKIVGMNFISLLKDLVFKGSVANIIDNQTPKFLNIRTQINEVFYETYLLPYFDALGELDLEPSKNLGLQLYESKQYLSLASMKRNMPLLFNG